MSIPRKGAPKWRLHPGEILRDQFLLPLGMSANRLARELHVSTPTVNDIVRQRRAITAGMAIRLARFFGTSEQFWLNLQNTYDLSCAKERLSRTVKAIKPKAGQAVA